MAAVAELQVAVRAWLAGLDGAQRARATFPFDTDERFVWQYTPGRREGLALADMAGEQRAAAMSIVVAAMSSRGAGEVEAIVALESILGALEREAGRAEWRLRDPEHYWFAVFGEPDLEGRPWAWRVGGHHVLVQSTVVGGRVAFAPSFLGANPAVVPSGPRAGFRALTGEELLARSLLASLPPKERAVAIVDPVAPPDILTAASARADVSAVPIGIRHDDMGPSQRAGLETLIQHYLGRARESVAVAEWERIVDAGLDGVTFAWAGSDESGRGHYYAVRGPSFLIEYDNTQNGANHIHAVWRDLANDWGEDILSRHYEAEHGPG
jgi:hypothetical protein